MIPGLYGLIPGVANLTGWGLLIILAIMIPCSLPFVRKTGFFEVLYSIYYLSRVQCTSLSFFFFSICSYFIGPTSFIIHFGFC